MSKEPPDKKQSDLLIYQAEDGYTRIEVRVDASTVWLTQAAMAELFQTTPQNITLHLRNIYTEKELDLGATCKDYLQVRPEGDRSIRRALKHYNLDAILAVGYRVRSHRGKQFRRWATERLREYLVKGFAMDDERLKRDGGGAYFDELLTRIRDIRSSEKVFWRKVLDIYATSIDYDPDVEASHRFFATVQNKMHWAAHGHTAAEIVSGRADATKPNMGLTAWLGSRPLIADIEVAKNYLGQEELDALNRIVTVYLEFAELQALHRRPMHMRDWIVKLDDFLRLSGREILSHAGNVSHDDAIAKARQEYDKYRAAHLDDAWPVEDQFLKTAAELKRLGEKKA